MVKHMLIAVVMCLAAASALHAEMRGLPPVDELYRRSSVVLQGQAVRVWPMIWVSQHVEYQIVTFRVVDGYKGKPSVMSSTRLTGEHGIPIEERGRFVNVLVQTKSAVEETALPEYKVGGKYVLFLGEPIADALHSRVEGDHHWQEREATAELVKQMELLRAAGAEKPK